MTSIREGWRPLRPALWPVLTLAALVYAPALQHVARADQILYLSEAVRLSTLFDLTVGSYAFNRTVVHADVTLFRPVMYALLGLEYWSFGYRFWLWQSASLALHLVIVATLWSFLRTWTSALAAILLCAYFAVQYASMEFVAWHHLAGYALSCALLAGAVRCLFPGDGERVHAAAGVALLGVCAFTYELGGIAAVAAAIAMLIARALGRQQYSRGLVAATAAVPALYFAVSMADLYLSGMLRYMDAAREGAGLLASAGNMLAAGALWSVFGFVPSLIGLLIGDRLEFRGIRPLDSPDLVIGLALLGVFLLAAGRVLYPRLDRARLQTCAPALLFLLLTMGGYCAMIVFGRVNERGFDFALGNASYYAYPFNLLLVMAAGVVAGRASTEDAAAVSRWARVAVAVVLISIAMNARGVLLTNRRMVTWSQQRADLIAGAVRLQRSHRGDPVFSFGVDGPCPANQPLPWYPSPTGAPATLLSLLFPGDYRDAGAAYTFACQAPKPLAAGAVPGGQGRPIGNSGNE